MLIIYVPCTCNVRIQIRMNTYYSGLSKFPNSKVHERLILKSQQETKEKRRRTSFLFRFFSLPELKMRSFDVILKAV